MGHKEAFDVVVVGSGAGGAPLACVLAEAGARVLILEKGPYYTSRDFVHDEVKTCRRDFWVPYLNEEPHTRRKTVQEPTKQTVDGWTSRCVGGATVHMSGFFYRLQDCDFKQRSLLGEVKDAALADWPITLEELLPFYDLMEARIGVSGRAGSNPFEVRRRPYPMPPIKPHPSAALFDEATRAMGLHPFPTPRAVASRTYGRRPPCQQCGLCGDYGCENASKSSMLVTFIPDAEATGRCEIRPRCMATRVLADNSDRATGVEYFDPEGNLRTVDGRVIVVACSAIESARLLLNSTSGRFPNGLANHNGLVGKNLMFLVLGQGSAIFDRARLQEKLGTADFHLPFFQRSVQDDYWRQDWALPKAGTYNFILAHPNLINGALRVAADSKWTLFGQALKDRIREHFLHELCVEFELFQDYLPWSGSFVDLDPEVQDKFGLPVARITSSNHPLCNEINRLMVRRGCDMLAAMKPAAKKVFARTWEDTTYHLPSGTCRFGDDPANSVLDRFCQAHEVKNLYVTDGSFMPSSGGAPLTPTEIANSLRVGEHLCARFSRREV